MEAECDCDDKDSDNSSGMTAEDVLSPFVSSLDVVGISRSGGDSVAVPGSTGSIGSTNWSGEGDRSSIIPSAGMSASSLEVDGAL